MTQKESSWMDVASRLAHDIFFISFFMYTVSFFLESLYKGSVVNFFNLNSILIICIGAGILSVARPPKETIAPHRAWNIIWICVLGIAAGIVSYQFLPDMWRWRVLYSGVIGLSLACILFVLSAPTDAAHIDS
jgi:hypothetical protein